MVAEILNARVASRFLVLNDSAGKLSSVVRERACLTSTREMAFMTSHIKFGVDLFAEILIRRVASRFVFGFQTFRWQLVFISERACMFKIHEGICIYDVTQWVWGWSVRGHSDWSICVTVFGLERFSGNVVFSSEGVCMIKIHEGNCIDDVRHWVWGWSVRRPSDSSSCVAVLHWFWEIQWDTCLQWWESVHVSNPRRNLYLWHHTLSLRLICSRKFWFVEWRHGSGFWEIQWTSCLQ